MRYRKSEEIYPHTVIGQKDFQDCAADILVDDADEDICTACLSSIEELNYSGRDDDGDMCDFCLTLTHSRCSAATFAPKSMVAYRCDECAEID